jgi:hypothetical protein
MADDENADRSEWLVEPPGAGEIRVLVELGEGAELSPEAAASLETLVSAINDAEVSGYMNSMLNLGLFGGIRLNSTCNKLACNKHDCKGTFVCDTYSSELFAPRV